MRVQLDTFSNQCVEAISVCGCLTKTVKYLNCYRYSNIHVIL